MKKMIGMIPFYAMVFLLLIFAALFTSTAVTAMAESAPLKGRTAIIVDAGHGGVDGGATSCTGVLESQLNLEIAIKLNDLLHLLGYETYMVRTTDVSVYTQGDTIAQKKVSDLKERVRLVNSTENALLISIHQNYFTDSRYSGAQVFYPGTGSSRLLAESLQRNLVDALNPGSQRQAKPVSGVYLMEHIQCTGVLIECGFLSNPAEEAKLRNADYQRKLCCVVASAVGNFLLS